MFFFKLFQNSILIVRPQTIKAPVVTKIRIVKRLLYECFRLAITGAPRFPSSLAQRISPARAARSPFSGPATEEKSTQFDESEGIANGAKI